MQGFAYHLPDVSSVAVYGGNDGIRYEQEKRAMQNGADVVIATPGRLISHLSLGNIDLSRVSFFILDEADRMLDMGFCDDILLIAKALPKEHQTIMFSATMPGDILSLAHSILCNPVEVKLAVSRPAENIRQSAYICYEPQKLLVVKHLFEQEAPHRVIIFTDSKKKTKELALSIIRAGYNARAMHSDLSQAERDEVMFSFRSGKTDILVATDIVARGIDIDDIALVINFDVPRDEEDYVHRIGRTARAGRGGRAVTFVAEKDMHYFRQIERFLGKEIPKEVMPEELGETPTYRSNMSGGKKHHSQGKQAEKGKGGDKSKKRRYYHNKKKQKKEGNK
jgi:superfamily II DNA/RNA helicase